MSPLYLSLSMRNADSVKTSVALIKDAPIYEGAERIPFQDWQLAGQWAQDYASSSAAEDLDEDTLRDFINIVADHCLDPECGGPVQFDRQRALTHAVSLVSAAKSGTPPELAFL